MLSRRLIALVLACAALTGSIAAQGKPSRLPERLDYAELSRLLSSARPPLLLDVRTAEEYAEGHIPGAALAPYDSLNESFSEPDKDRPIVVYCRSGRRSAIALQTLRAMGYTNLADFGAITKWLGQLARR